jgi:hypothetical protein
MAPSAQPISSSTTAIGGHPEHGHQEKEGVVDKTKGLLTKAKDKVKDVFTSNKEEGERPSGHTGAAIPPGHVCTTTCGHQGTARTGHQATTQTGHQGTTPSVGHKGLPGSEIKNLPTQL